MDESLLEVSSSAKRPQDGELGLGNQGLDGVWSRPYDRGAFAQYATNEVEGARLVAKSRNFEKFINKAVEKVPRLGRSVFLSLPIFLTVADCMS